MPKAYHVDGTCCKIMAGLESMSLATLLDLNRIYISEFAKLSISLQLRS